MGWDDPVTEHIPFFELDVDSDREDAVATIRDLLAHRTGFARMTLLFVGGDASRSEVLHTAAKAEPWTGFRQRFLYNNVMYLATGVALPPESDLGFVLLANVTATPLQRQSMDLVWETVLGAEQESDAAPVDRQEPGDDYSTDVVRKHPACEDPGGQQAASPRRRRSRHNDWGLR